MDFRQIKALHDFIKVPILQLIQFFIIILFTILLQCLRLTPFLFGITHCFI
eukprot:TRINITY_DN5526_c0_g2_i1.p1 TRINITY_DN5526_c0_g2~~TRINITY_DN5526_c0_g2_i1.p1  ORF type:complete len:51 (+),score=2.49 TRINITY_DN5526_c0_g2_i1:229-381(+)